MQLLHVECRGYITALGQLVHAVLHSSHVSSVRLVEFMFQLENVFTLFLIHIS